MKGPFQFLDGESPGRGSARRQALVLIALAALAACTTNRASQSAMAPTLDHSPVPPTHPVPSAETPSPLPASPTSPSPLSGVIAFEEFENHAIYLLDLATGTFRRVEPPTPSLQDIVGKPSDGCGVIVAPPRSDNGELAHYDLEANLVATLARYSWGSLDGSWLEKLTVSPDNARIAFIAGRATPTSQLQLRPDLQDLFVAPIESPDDRVPVSLHGGSWTAVWSPDSSKIAFDDLDTNGVPQLFVASFDPIQIHQLTHLDSDTRAIRFIRWSPDASVLAFSVETNYDGSYRVSLFTVPPDGPPSSQPTPVLDSSDSPKIYISELWSPDNNTLAVVADIERSGKSESGVFRLSPQGEGLLSTLMPLPYPHSIPRPLDDHLAYFDDEGRFIVIEPSTGAQLAQYKSPVSFAVDWVLLTADNDERSQCN